MDCASMARAGQETSTNRSDLTYVLVRFTAWCLPTFCPRASRRLWCIYPSSVYDISFVPSHVIGVTASKAFINLRQSPM
jgi:hypothetical protein